MSIFPTKILLATDGSGDAELAPRESSRRRTLAERSAPFYPSLVFTIKRITAELSESLRASA